MEAILHTFGIDWRLLLVNAINFGLLLAVLSYFLYKPMLKMLEDRRTHIAAGVAASNEAKERLAKIEETRQETIQAAAREADDLVRAAREAGNTRSAELVAAGERRAAAAVAEAELQAKELKERALQESKAEVAKLIVLGIEKTAKHK